MSTMADFSSPDLIQLPRLSGQEAASLIGDMLAIARSRQASLPGPIERSVMRLQAAHAALEVTLRGARGATSHPPSSGGPASSRAPISTRAQASSRAGAAVISIVRRRADRAVDSAWEATFDWLSGWCKLTDDANPYRSAARELFELVFADALAFGTLPYKIEFAQSRERLEAIEREGHDATFTALGGAAFLAHLRSVHEALQIIVSQETVIDCREQLAVAAAALRQYVVRVSSHADSEISGSEELSSALMAPLDRWQKLHPARPPEDAFGVVEETLF
jgi:hypothetical protein